VRRRPRRPSAALLTRRREADEGTLGLIGDASEDSQEFELTLRYRFNAAKSKYKGTGAGTGELERL